MDEDFSRQTGRFSTAVLTYGRAPRYSVEPCFALVLSSFCYRSAAIALPIQPLAAAVAERLIFPFQGAAALWTDRKNISGAVSCRLCNRQRHSETQRSFFRYSPFHSCTISRNSSAKRRRFFSGSSATSWIVSRSSSVISRRSKSKSPVINTAGLTPSFSAICYSVSTLGFPRPRRYSYSAVREIPSSSENSVRDLFRFSITVRMAVAMFSCSFITISPPSRQNYI